MVRMNVSAGMIALFTLFLGVCSSHRSEEVQGGIPSEQVRVIIESTNKDLKECAQKEWKRKKMLDPVKLTVELEIDREGNVNTITNISEDTKVTENVYKCFSPRL